MIKTIEQDIHLYLEKANPFPQDVAGSFERIYQKTPNSQERALYGVSYINEKQEIIYFAALQKQPTENYDAPTYILKAGNFITQELKNFREHMPQFAVIFQNFYKHPDIDLSSLAIEFYPNPQDCILMARLTK